jgi:FkbM family methyltransferase
VTNDACAEEAPGASHIVSIDRHGRPALFTLLDPSEHIQSHHARGCFYEEDLLDALHALLAPDDLVLDVGANIGNHTVFLAAIRQCRVIAIEPDPGNFAHLERNVALNQLAPRVTLIHAAASDVSGACVQILSRVPGNSGAVSVGLTDEDTGIPSIRLDDLQVGGVPKLIKVDTEGMDLAVLRGASELLARSDPIVVVEAADIEEYDAIAAFLEQFSYVCVDAHNTTPTFVFVKEEVPAQCASLVKRLTTVFAHQRLSLSFEISRLNLAVRGARKVYAQAKADLNAERTALKAALEAHARVKADLNAERTALKAALDETRSSESYVLGNAIVNAFTRPGRNTLLLPWALARLLLGRGVRANR